jgi:hypothetical protein
LDSDNEGNFDNVKKEIKEVLDKTDIDDKVVDAVNKIKDKTTKKGEGK